MNRYPLSFLLFALLLAGCASSEIVGTMADDTPIVENEPLVPDDILTADILRNLPDVNREFRAVWIATVDNIDWPSEPGLPVHRQKAEMLELLDRASMMNLNAVIFQIRPTADAMFASELEPWSYYLTGENPLAPDPFYDPLEFAIEEAHRRGIELHAWFNPYRAYHPTAPDSLAYNHVKNLFPEAVHRYGEQLWMDPGSKVATEHSISVIMDVVERYDIDGVHLDDYFYPYSVNDAEGNRVEFPDSAFFVKQAGHLDLGDWRRKNVDDLVEGLYLNIKERKPWVLFGISPFGIWRPGHPEGVTGFDAYANLYADARKWLARGWVDYFTPQLYWAMESTGQPYGALLDWWVEQNTRNRHLWPGNFTSRIILEGNSHWEPDEVISQVRYTRLVPEATGNVHFSMRAIMPADHGMGRSLTENVYSKPAIRPRTTWLGMDSPQAPEMELQHLGSNRYASLKPRGEAEVRNWIINVQSDGEWETRILPGWNRVIPLQKENDATALVVRAVNRLGLESEPTVLILR